MHLSKAMYGHRQPEVLSAVRNIRGGNYLSFWRDIQSQPSIQTVLVVLDAINNGHTWGQINDVLHSAGLKTYAI